MNNQYIQFTDAAGMHWTLTVLPEGKTRFLLGPTGLPVTGILIAAEKAELRLDETSSNSVPFALELDDNCTVFLTTEAMETLDEFLQNIDEFIEVTV